MEGNTQIRIASRSVFGGVEDVIRMEGSAAVEKTEYGWHLQYEAVNCEDEKSTIRSDVKLENETGRAIVVNEGEGYGLLLDPAAVTASQVELLVQETCVAEVVHTASILLGLGALWLWPGWGGVVLWLIWFLLANLPFILIQRYNRPRLMRLHALLQRREQRKGTHEHSDTDL